MLSLSFGNVEGEARYRFSLDRQTLALRDGETTWGNSLSEDISWTIAALGRAIQGEQASPRALASAIRPWSSPARHRTLSSEGASGAAGVPGRIPGYRIPTGRISGRVMEVIRASRICVRPRRIEANIDVATGFRTTTPELAARICARFSNLVHHACVNDEGPTFGAVIDDTPLPHLLEHLVIDLQVAAEKSGILSQSFTYVGTTQWLDEQRGLARVEVNFTDDLVALRAFKDALCAINEAVVL